MSHTIKGMRRSDRLGFTFGLAASLACASCALQADETEDLSEVSLAIDSSCNINVPNAKDIWISPNGNKDNPGTFLLPKKSLQNVHDELITDIDTKNYVIHVDGGVYRGQKAEWSSLHPEHSITIEACPNTVPIFDGQTSSSDTQPEEYLIKLSPAQSGPTNVTFKNLTIRNYYQHGMLFNAVARTGPTTSNNTVDGCTFENIGSALFPGAAQEDDNNDNDGVSAINVARSSHNFITNNRFVAIEDEPGEEPQLHAIYCAYGSSWNTIAGNSFDTCSGDPIKLRDGSNNNLVHANSFNRCGHKSIISVQPNTHEYCPGEHPKECPKECVNPAHPDPEDPQADDHCDRVEENPSTGNEASENVITFPHPRPDPDIETVVKCNESAVPGEECDPSLVAFESDNFVVLENPNDEQVAAIVGGDFDGDGRDEVVVAFNYDGQEGFSKIMSTAGSVDNRHLHSVLFANDRWNINAMTSCDCNSDGDLELLTALQFVDGKDWVYSGDGRSHRTGLGSSIYSSSFWDIAAMAGGDYDGDGDDEVITTFEAANQTKIYSGNGTTSLTNIATLMTDDQAPYVKITAQTSGDFGNGNDELVTALNSVGSSSAIHKIHAGNGVTSVANTTLHEDSTSPYWQTTASVAGDFDDDGTEELITAMYRLGTSPSYKLYRGNGTTAVDSSTIASSSTPFFVRAAGAADYNGDGDLDLVTAVETPGTSPALRIVVGNGVGSYTGLGTLYSSTYMD